MNKQASVQILLYKYDSCISINTLTVDQIDILYEISNNMDINSVTNLPSATKEVLDTILKPNVQSNSTNNNNNNKFVDLSNGFINNNNNNFTNTNNNQERLEMEI